MAWKRRSCPALAVLVERRPLWKVGSSKVGFSSMDVPLEIEYSESHCD